MGALASSVSFSISALLSTMGGSVPRERYQDPKIFYTKAGSPFIRPWIDVLTASGIERRKKTVVLGPASMPKRDQVSKKRAFMEAINRASYVIQSQVPMSELLTIYEKRHLLQLASSTEAKYQNHLDNHIRPAFEKFQLCEITTSRVQDWLDAKPLSWSTKSDIRNILSSVFTKARDWGMWNERNPIEGVTAGRKKMARERRKLSDDQTRRMAFSGGKDSATVVTLVADLIEAGRIEPPQSLTVLYADTRMELPPLQISAMGILAELRERGIETRVVYPEMDDRYFVYMLGRGVPPPKNRFRWCTSQIKIEPMIAALRDLRDKDVADTLAPLLHWRVCHVWAWLTELSFEHKHRLRKVDVEITADGKIGKNPQRVGPLSMDARRYALSVVLEVQAEINESARRLGRPELDILNADEHARILALIEANTWPRRWTGDEAAGDELIDRAFNDGTWQPLLGGIVNA